MMNDKDGQRTLLTMRPVVLLLAGAGGGADPEVRSLILVSAER